MATRYEKAKEDKNSIPLFMTSDGQEIFGPDDLHLVKGLRSEWRSIADEEDVREQRERFIAMDFAPLSNISSDPRIKKHLDEVSKKLMRDDPHLPGEK